MISCFHLFWKNILSAMYADWGPPHLSLVVCYVFHLLMPLLCNTWFYDYCNRNNVPKDRCSITMDTTVRLGPLKFSLRAAIDHHGPSIHFGHYTAYINCYKKHSFATITQLRSLELLPAKTHLLHMFYYMNWLTHDYWTRTGGWEFARSHGAGTSSPSQWQQVEEQAPKPVGWMMCFLLMTFVPVQKLCVNIYIYICFSIWVLFSLVYQLCLALW